LYHTAPVIVVRVAGGGWLYYCILVFAVTAPTFAPLHIVVVVVLRHFLTF